MIIKNTKTILSIATAAILPLVAGAATKTITTDEEWYDPSDWFDGDKVDYETVEVPDNETNTYASTRSATSSQSGNNALATDRDDDLDLDLETNTYAKTPSANTDKDSNKELDLKVDAYASNQNQGKSDLNRNSSRGMNEDDLEFVYLSYTITPAKDGNKKWNKTGNSVSARMEYNQIGQDQDRQYVRGQQSSSTKDKSSSTSSSDRMQLRGKIDAISSINVEGKSKDNDVIKIELENGESAVVDLGTKNARKDLELDEGDRIFVRGKKEKLDGKSIIVAEKVTIGNASGKSSKSSMMSDHKEKHSESKSKKDNNNSRL